MKVNCLHWWDSDSGSPVNVDSPFHCHYSQVHFNTVWKYLLRSYLRVKLTFLIGVVYLFNAISTFMGNSMSNPSLEKNSRNNIQLFTEEVHAFPMSISLQMKVMG